MIYHIENFQNITSKGDRAHRVKSGGTRQRLLEPSLGGVTQDMLPPPNDEL